MTVRRAREGAHGGPGSAAIDRPGPSAPARSRGWPWISAGIGVVGCTAAPCPDAPTRAELRDENNFHHEVQLDAATVPLLAESDAIIHWESLTVDMLGHPLDPMEDIDSVSLLVFDGIDAAGVAEAIATDTLLQTKFVGVFGCFPHLASCPLSEFSFFGTPDDVPSRFTEGSGTWMLALESTDEPAYRQYRKLLFIEPDASSSAQDAAFSDGSSMFSVEADLTSTEPLRVGPGPSQLVSWGELTVDGAGRPIDLGRVDTLWIAKYEGLSPEEIESSLVDLEVLGSDYWQLPIEGLSEVDLADLLPVEEGGREYTGVDESGTYLLGLRCSSCNSPMPYFLTVLTTGCE